MPDTYERLATSVLVAHQRRDIGSCLCGWSELGRSHAVHVAAVLAAAGALQVAPAERRTIDCGEYRDLKLRQASDAGQIVGLRYRAQVAEDQRNRFEEALRRIASYQTNGAPAAVAREALGRLADQT